MASLPGEMHRQRDLAKRLAVTEQAALNSMAELTIEHLAGVLNAPDDTAVRLRFAD
jgi:hypothetical protein